MYNIVSNQIYSISIPIVIILTQFITITLTTFDHPNTRENADSYNRQSYALHPEKAAKLALLEEKLFLSLSKVKLISNKHSYNNKKKHAPNKCQLQLQIYATNYKEDAKNLDRVEGRKKAKLIVENPIFTLRMIRRLFTLITTLSDLSCVTILKILKLLFEKENLTRPIKKDLEEALLGILRIQYIYGLNSSDMQSGNLYGVKTQAILNFDDCIALARKAIEMNGETLAYQWIQTASSLMHSSIGSCSNFSTALHITTKSLMSLANVSTDSQLHLKMRNRHQTELLGFTEYESYASCRGETKRILTSHLRCLYFDHNWNPYFTISPEKAEIIMLQPLILQFYDFVSKTSMNYIKRKSARLLLQSTVVNVSGTFFVKERTSLGTFLSKEEDQNPIMIKLNSRIEKITDLEVIKNNASNLQVVVYSAMGGHYDFHYDSLRDANRLNLQGDRIATFLMFLSDVTLGGYTAFPDVNLYVKPIKGSAILWYSVLPNGEIDTGTRHGGCPVILGHKFVANRWIMGKENMWKFPCYNLPKT